MHIVDPTIQPGPCSKRDRREVGSANASLRLGAQRPEDVGRMVYHQEMQGADSVERTRPCMRGGLWGQWERAAIVLSVEDGVGKPGDGWLRHMLPHCNWEVDERNNYDQMRQC